MIRVNRLRFTVGELDSGKHVLYPHVQLHEKHLPVQVIKMKYKPIDGVEFYLSEQQRDSRFAAIHTFCMLTSVLPCTTEQIDHIDGKINTWLNYSSFVGLAGGRTTGRTTTLASPKCCRGRIIATGHIFCCLLSLHLTSSPAEPAHGHPFCIFLFLPQSFYLEEGAFCGTGGTACFTQHQSISLHLGSGLSV